MQNPIPSTGFLRLRQILGDPKRGIPPIIPVGRTAWYQGIRRGFYPRPLKVGRMSLWRAEDIKTLIDRLGRESAPHKKKGA